MVVVFLFLSKLDPRLYAADTGTGVIVKLQNQVWVHARPVQHIIDNTLQG